MRGIVTLLTDFGQKDAFVGVMKGVLLGRNPQLAIVDLTHDVEPGDRLAAAFHLRSALPYFPPGTVHVVVVDPGVGSERRILVAKIGSQLVLAPDNGLLSPLLERGARARALEDPSLRLDRVSRTFHGRDVFAPAAAALASGSDPEAVGPLVEPLRDDSLWPSPRIHADGIDGCVVHVDRFGNLISNIEGRSLGGESGVLRLAECWEGPLAGTYASAATGQTVAVISSTGLVEVAVRDGSAAEVHGLRRGATLRWRRCAAATTPGS